MHPFIQNIKVYVTSNLPNALAATIGGFITMLFIWLISAVWSNNTDKLTEIAASSESTSKSMHELVVWVKEDRIRIINLERRADETEEFRKKYNEDVQDFWKNYYYNPNKKSK